MLVRISRAFMGYLSGSESWQSPEKDPEAGAIMARCQQTKRYADGAIVIRLDANEALILRDYAEAMEMIALEGLPWEARCLGELNAARTMLRRLDPAITF